jgi:hypothetical protein
MQPLRQGGSEILFVGKHLGHDTHNLIHLGAPGPQQFEVRNRGWIETASQDSDPSRHARRPLNKLHVQIFPENRLFFKEAP